MLIVGNFSQTRFIGWCPGTVYDPTLAHGACNVALKCPAMVPANQGTQHAPVDVWVGERLGQVRSAWALVDLEPGQVLAIDVANGTRIPNPHVPMVPKEVMADPAGTHQPTINGLPLQLVPNEHGQVIEQDGPALRAHWRGRVGLATWADLMIAWVPSEAWARFELVLNTANPSVSATSETFPNGFELRIGNGIVGFLGSRFGRILERDSMAQGQGRAFAGAVYWPHLGSDVNVEMLGGLLHGSPAMVDQQLRDVVAGLGVPERADGFNVRAFVARTYPEAAQVMFRWQQHSAMGVAANSGVTGAQEEQCFSAKGAECFGMGIENVIAAVSRYLVALTVWKRPCHWREADGRLLDFDTHPQLVLWSSMPHWHTGVSPDRLGMAQLPTDFERHNWMGPDREHWFYGSTWLASMLFGSRALQLELEAQARLVWFGETVRPGLSTSNAGSARGVGWFGIVATALWCCLRDRNVASRVRARAIDRGRMVWVPQLSRPAQPAIWDQRRDDRLSNELAKHYEDILMPDGSTIPTSPTLPPAAISYRTVYHYPLAWMPYQQAVGAAGADIMGEAFGLPEVRAVALQGALAVVELAYTEDPERAFREWEVLGIPEGGGPLPPSEMVQGQGAHSTGWFRHAWLPLAAWVVLRHNPTHARARAIYDRLLGEAKAGQGTLDWLPPVDRPLTVPAA